MLSKILSHSFSCIQDKRKHRTCEHLFELSKYSRRLSPVFMYSFNLFLKFGTVLFCRKFSHVFSSATFNSETVLGFGWSFQKASRIAPQTWYLQGVQIWRVKWPLSQFWLIFHFACRRCWATRAVCVEPHASRWICRSVRQQSVAVFSKIWKQN